MSEIMGALFKFLAALIGVAAVVLVLYMTLGTNKTEATISDQTNLATGIQTLYNGQVSFGTVSNTVAIKSGVAPKDMVSGTTVLQNKYGGSVTVAPSAANSADFTITQTQVPSSSCGKMVTSIAGILGLSINGTNETLPMDAGSATTACGAATNTLVYTYGH